MRPNDVSFTPKCCCKPAASADHCHPFIIMNSLPILQSEFKDRLITLSDGSAGLRGGLVVNVVAPEVPSTAPVLDFIASSETPDRYAEIISADGWRLENYQRNPVFQNAH